MPRKRVIAYKGGLDICEAHPEEHWKVVRKRYRGQRARLNAIAERLDRGDDPGDLAEDFIEMMEHANETLRMMDLLDEGSPVLSNIAQGLALGQGLSTPDEHVKLARGSLREARKVLENERELRTYGHDGRMHFGTALGFITALAMSVGATRDGQMSA